MNTPTAPEEKKDVKEVMPRTVNDTDSIPHQMMDQADEDQILGDIKGTMMSEFRDKWIYEFPMNGSVVRGLTWVGTKELRYWLAKHNLAKITELPEYASMTEVTHDGKQYVDCKVAMKDLVTGIMATATVRQAYLRKGGGAMDVEFVPRIAESKAQRNAIQKLIPASTLADFVAEAKKENKVQTLAPSKQGTALAPDENAIAAPYLSKIEALETIEEAKAYWVLLGKETSKVSGKIMYNLKAALSLKADKIKTKAANEKIKKLHNEG